MNVPKINAVPLDNNVLESRRKIMGNLLLTIKKCLDEGYWIDFRGLGKDENSNAADVTITMYKFVHTYGTHLKYAITISKDEFLNESLVMDKIEELKANI